MSLNQYEIVRRYLHTNGNTEKKDDSSSLFKVKTVVLASCTNCLNVEQKQYQSIEKQMVPAETKSCGIPQYLPKKIHIRGFKNFVRTGTSAVIYNFFYNFKKVLGERNAVRLK